MSKNYTDMTRKKLQNRPEWHETTAAHAAYVALRKEAQAAANADGIDRGIERTALQTFRYFMLPWKEHRAGHELTCEVVQCEDLTKRAKGY